MAKNGIETIAARTLKDFLVSKSRELVSGMTSNGQPIGSPTVTRSPATPPTNTGPFIAVMITGHDLEFENSSPLAIKSSVIRVLISVEDVIEAQPDDDQIYEVSTENHSDISDRIIRELFNTFEENRTISDSETGFAFKPVPADGMQRINGGGPIWTDSSFYIEAKSEITFSLGSACEQATF
jgi:hypothetical protein